MSFLVLVRSYELYSTGEKQNQRGEPFSCVHARLAEGSDAKRGMGQNLYDHANSKAPQDIKSKTHHSIWFPPSSTGMLLRAIKAAQLKPFCSIWTHAPLPPPQPFSHAWIKKKISLIKGRGGWLNFNSELKIFRLSRTVASTGFNLWWPTKQNSSRTNIDSPHASTL